jgi:hypothetical protein
LPYAFSHLPNSDNACKVTGCSRAVMNASVEQVLNDSLTAP